MFKLVGKSAANRDVLFVGIEKGNVDRLVEGNPLMIYGQDFVPHIAQNFMVAYLPNMADFRAGLAIRSPQRWVAYDHSAFLLQGPTELHVIIDPFVINLIQQGGLSIMTTSKIRWTTDLYLFYRESLQEPECVEAAEEWLKWALKKLSGGVKMTPH